MGIYLQSEEAINDIGERPHARTGVQEWYDCKLPNINHSDLIKVSKHEG